MTTRAVEHVAMEKGVGSSGQEVLRWQIEALLDDHDEEKNAAEFIVHRLIFALIIAVLPFIQDPTERLQKSIGRGEQHDDNCEGIQVS